MSTFFFPICRMYMYRQFGAYGQNVQTILLSPLDAEELPDLPQVKLV